MITPTDDCSTNGVEARDTDQPASGLGSSKPVPPIVHAGPVSAILDGIDLRRIRVGTAEIARRITMAVRDVHWNTVPSTVSKLELNCSEREFHMHFEARSCGGGIDLVWRGTVHGAGDGVISYGFGGRSQRDCEYARIGICVLHSPSEHRRQAYRASCRGRISNGSIPAIIAPQRYENAVPLALFPPYDELAIALAHGGEVQFSFDGDLFEMEDQRNWTDASFKSYSTPFALGMSHKARHGDTISQRVTIRTAGVTSSTSDQQARLVVGGETGATLPPIGFGYGSDRGELSPRDIALLRLTAPDHIHVELDLGSKQWERALKDALEVCRRLGCALELALSTDAEMDSILDYLGAQLQDQPVARVLIFARQAKVASATETTPPQLMALARKHLASRLQDVPIGGGTDMYFAELNRNPPDLQDMDIVSFAIMPQVHASDDTSLFETLEGQADAVRSALILARGRPVTVGPITLRHRRPLYGPSLSDSRGLPDSVDPRQTSRLLAAWTVGSVKACTEAGASALTYFETTGPQGLVERENGVPLPGFPSSPGMVFPVHAVFKELSRYKRCKIITCSSSRPFDVNGLALRHRDTTTVFVMNMTLAHQTVSIDSMGHECGLDEIAGEAVATVVGSAVRIELEPYGVAMLHGTR